MFSVRQQLCARVWPLHGPGVEGQQLDGGGPGQEKRRLLRRGGQLLPRGKHAGRLQEQCPAQISPVQTWAQLTALVCPRLYELRENFLFLNTQFN